MHVYILALRGAIAFKLAYYGGTWAQNSPSCQTRCVNILELVRGYHSGWGIYRRKGIYAVLLQ